MASMNLLNIKKEIINLNNLINDLKKENYNLRNEIDNINNQIIDVNIKKPNIIEITNFVDDIKEEMICLSDKVDKINKKRFFKEIITLDNFNETHIFLREININDKIINLLTFLNYNTINDLCQLNIDDLLIYNVEKKTIEYIIQKACDKIGALN